MKAIALLSSRGRRRALAVLWLVASASAFAQAEDSALRMVKALRLGENLAGTSFQLARVTTAYRGMAARLGTQKADQLLKAELAVALPKYQPEWDRNLAQAWGALMTPAEMDSIAKDPRASPYAAKFNSLQGHAGAAMREKSEPLLVTLLEEALGRAAEKSKAAK